MFRQLLVVLLLAVAIVMATALVSQAQYDPIYDQNQASVFTVPGRVVRVIYDPGSYTADGQLVYYDQVLTKYYALDRRLCQDWADAPNSGDNRPVAGDELTCEIDTETFELLAVTNWYRPSRPNLYFVYEPDYYHHRHLIIWPQYYRRHFGGYYHGPRFYGGHHYNGPRYRSRDGWDHQPRYGPPPPRYLQPRDHGDRPRQYAPRNQAPRRSSGEYQRPGGRGQYGPPSDRRNRPRDNHGIRPRPSFSPSSPSDRPRDQRMQTPFPRSRPPRDQGIRPRNIAPRSPSTQPTDQYRHREQSGQRPGSSERPQYRQQRPHEQRSGSTQRSRGLNDQSRRSPDDRSRSRR